MESAKYWDERYSSGGNSGAGSYGEQLEKKLKWLSGLDVKSITEIGCGDFNFGSHLMEMYPEGHYIGFDISKEVIKQNRKKYNSRNFRLLTKDFRRFTTKVVHPDLLLCIDVLFHTLDDKDYEDTLKLLEKSYTKYLAVTAYEYDQGQGLAPHVKIRKFDYKRFGEPIIREVVEEEGQLYFYLFKKNEGIDLTKVTAVLNTKDAVYPPEVLASVARYPFGEILIKTGSDSPHRKYEMFEKAKYNILYYSDDDAIVDIPKLVSSYKPEMINVGMKQSHFDQYKNLRMTQGLGWGCFFDKSVLKELKRYTDIYGEDEVFKRDTEKLLTHLVYPQNRIIIDVKDMPYAVAPDRLSLQPHHYDNMRIIEERCRDLI